MGHNFQNRNISQAMPISQYDKLFEASLCTHIKLQPVGNNGINTRKNERTRTKMVTKTIKKKKKTSIFTPNSLHNYLSSVNYRCEYITVTANENVLCCSSNSPAFFPRLEREAGRG